MKVFKINIIGTGNVGSFLIETLKHKVDIVTVYSRSMDFNEENSSFINEFEAIDPNADITILAVSDDEIEEVSSRINTRNLVVHTSGSVSIEALKNQQQRGVLYPFQTISKNRKLASKDIPFFIEANGDDQLRLLKLFCENFLSDKISFADSQKRKVIHLSGVIANNFTTFLFHEASEILRKNDIDPALLEPLIKETVSKFLENGYHLSQTGPARRNDIKTMTEQGKMMEDDQMKVIYEAISEKIKSNFNSQES